MKAKEISVVLKVTEQIFSLTKRWKHVREKVLRNIQIADKSGVNFRILQNSGKTEKMSAANK